MCIVNVINILELGLASELTKGGGLGPQPEHACYGASSPFLFTGAC